MTKEELSKLAREGELDEILKQLFSGIPQVFHGAPSEYQKLKTHLATVLKVTEDGIVLVGSGRFGYSLSPLKFGRPFNSRSDLDFIIVDPSFFDAAWSELIRYDVKSLTFGRDIQTALKEHRTNNVFWGYLEPDNLKNALSSYKVWFPAFAGLGFFRACAGRKVRTRVYRTWEHASNYHRFGLRLLVTAGEKDEI